MKRDYKILIAVVIFTGIMMYFSYNIKKQNEAYEQIYVNNKEYFVNDNLEMGDIINSGIPTLVQVGSLDCLACKDLLPILYEVRDNSLEKATVFFVDYRKHPKLANYFDYKITPTLFFYNEKGKLFKKHEGFITYDGIMSIFEKEGYKFD